MEYWMVRALRVPARRKNTSFARWIGGVESWRQADVRVAPASQLVCTDAVRCVPARRNLQSQSERWLYHGIEDVATVYCCPNYCKHAAIPRAGPNGLGAQPCRIGYTEVPFRARFVYYSSVLYRIIIHRIQAYHYMNSWHLTVTNVSP